MPIDPACFRRRWICYADLLGFSTLVETKGWDLVYCAYTRALEILKRQDSYRDLTKYTWFSDTFILYTEDDNSESYLSIERLARYFTYFLIAAEIPLRGSIAVGEFYADPEYNIFFGRALIEAYRYGECQDWIGLIQCPSTVAKLLEYGLDVRSQLNYVPWKIPFKKQGKGLQSELPAYRIGEHLKIDGKNQCLEKLRQMSGRNENAVAIGKYQRTIQFIEENQLVFDQAAEDVEQ